MELTCIHRTAGLCPACLADYEDDPLAWLEYGDHDSGVRRSAELSAELAAAVADAEAAAQLAAERAAAGEELPVYGDDEVPF